MVVERIEGGGDDDGAGPQGPGDVGEGVVGADVAGGRVDDGPGPGGQHGLDVVARPDLQLVFEAREFTRVAADLGGVVDQYGDELQCRVGLDGTDGRAPDISGTPDNGRNHARRVAPGPEPS